MLLFVVIAVAFAVDVGVLMFQLSMQLLLM